MHNISGNFVQERSVVGDHEDGARVSLKVIGQESNRRNIQHVGRFCGNLVNVLFAKKCQIIPSSRSRSGSQNKARAKANRILQPPEKVLVA